MKLKIIVLCAFYFNSIFLFGQEKKYFPLEFVYGNSELDSFYNDNMLLLPNTPWINQIAFDTEVCVSQEGKILSSSIKNINIDFELITSQRTRKVVEDSLIGILNHITKMTEGLWVRAELNEQFITDTLKQNITIDYKKIIKRDVGEVIKIGSEVISVFTVPFMIYYNNGVKKLSQGKPFIASKLFEEAIKIHSHHSDSWYNLGVSESLLGNKRSACNAWETCSSFDVECKNMYESKCLVFENK
jgi:hypothetical protein